MTEEPEIKLATSVGSSKKPETTRKTFTSVLLISQSLWLCRSQQTVENSSRDGNNKLPYLPPEKSVCRLLPQEATVRTEHETIDWFQVRKGICVLYILSCSLFNLWCRIHHVKCWAEWITSWNQDCQEKYQQPQISRWYHSNGKKWKETKESLDEGERGEWKGWLKTQHSKN